MVDLLKLAMSRISHNQEHQENKEDETGTIDKDKLFEGMIAEQGQRDLNSFVNLEGSECLNEDDDHPFLSCLSPGPGHLQSNLH